MASRFEKFTYCARKAMFLAQEEAQYFNHNLIGTEHILLGLVRETEGVAGRVLSQFGSDLSIVRSAVESITEKGEHSSMDAIDITPRARKVIELAVYEARSLKHHYIGTEHLLIGLIREGGVAARALDSLEVNLDKIRSEISLMLTQGRDHRNEILLERILHRILELSPSEFQELARGYLKAKGFSDAEADEIVIKMKA